MIEPEPSRPHEGGSPAEGASPGPASRWQHWLGSAFAAVRNQLERWGMIGPGEPPPPPERAYGFLAQRLVHDLPARAGGTVLALTRVCAAPFAADTALLMARALSTESGKGVLLVDADFTAGLVGLSARFAAEGAGLSELVAGSKKNPAPLLVETNIAGVRLLPLGLLAALPGAIGREGLGAVLSKLREAAGHVLLLQSPLGEDARSVPLAAAADLVVIIAEEAATRLPEIERSEALLAAAGVDDPKLILAMRRSAPGPAWLRAG